MITREQAARDLASYWSDNDDALVAVFVFEAEDDSAPIRLLEVTSSTPASGSVEPFGFRATKDVPYRTSIAQVTPDELERIERGELGLPKGWQWSQKKTVYRRSAQSL